MQDLMPGKKVRALGPVPELVYSLLKDGGGPMHHKDITDRIIEILSLSPVEVDTRFVARLHTEINLDNRFYHMGQGMWGLREWAPKRSMQQKQAPSWQPKGKSRRPEIFRVEEEVEEHARTDEEESDWPKENEEENERPEAW